MGLLDQVLGNAKQQVKQQVKGVDNRIKSGARGAVSNAVNNVTTGAVGAISGTLNAGVNGLTGAAAAIMRGDFNGALTKITDVPSEVAKAIGASAGAIFGPGGGSAFGLGGPNTPGDGLAGALSRADPMLAFNWYCELPVLFPTSGPAVGLAWQYVEEASVPFRNLEVRSSFREGRQKHYAKGYSLDNLRLSFYLDSDSQTLNYLKAWEQLILSPTTQKNYATNTGGFGRPVDYKRNIRVYFLNNNKTKLGVLEYVECWPINIDQLTLVSNSSERLVAHVNFSVGDMFATYYSVNADLISSLGIGEELIFPAMSSAYNSISNSALGKFASSAASSLGESFSTQRSIPGAGIRNLL